MDTISFLWGAAVGVIGAFGAGFLRKAGEDCYSWVRMRIYPKGEEPHSSHLVIHMNTESVQNLTQGTSLSETQHTVLERVSVITLDEINSSLVDAPPLQRPQVAERYVGLRVEWETKFVGGTLQENGDIRVHLNVANAKQQPKAVWCEVPATEYRELGILPEDSSVRVSGEIEKVASYGIDLKDARLHIYGIRNA